MTRRNMGQRTEERTTLQIPLFVELFIHQDKEAIVDGLGLLLPTIPGENLVNPFTAHLSENIICTDASAIHCEFSKHR